jgi:predicted NUDIX family phosphoesterase
MGKEALVVKREVLFGNKYFEGFMPQKEHDFISVILKNHHYHPRGDELEHNADLQQVIPYVWIINPKTKEVFAYRRANNDKYAEARLRNKWSCGLGGHIERSDNGNPINTAMMRELREEISMEKYPVPNIVGYLNDDQGDVERVHFGVVAIAETLGDVQKGDEEMAEGRFFSISGIEALFADPKNDIEKWTLMSWPFVREYLTSLR